MNTSPARRTETSGGEPVRAALYPALNREQAESTAGVLRVVSNATRLQLLSLMHNSPSGRVRVTDLADALGLRQPTITYHLTVLAEAGLIARLPEGREVWCSIVPERLAAIGDLLR